VLKIYDENMNATYYPGGDACAESGVCLVKAKYNFEAHYASDIFYSCVWNIKYVLYNF
jgi:hypothetical protein